MKARNRTGSGIKAMEEFTPSLYLKYVTTGKVQLALGALLGDWVSCVCSR